MVRSVARASRMASGAARRSPRDQGQVGGLDRDVGAGSHRQPEIGLGERGGVVDPVADHRHDLALALQSLDLVHLFGGQHLGDHLVDADLAGDRVRRAAVVAGEQHRVSGRARAARRSRRASVSLMVSETTMTARIRPSTASQTAVLAVGLGPIGGVAKLVGSLQRPLVVQPAVAPGGEQRALRRRR